MLLHTPAGSSEQLLLRMHSLISEQKQIHFTGGSDVVLTFLVDQLATQSQFAQQKGTNTSTYKVKYTYQNAVRLSAGSFIQCPLDPAYLGKSRSVNSHYNGTQNNAYSIEKNIVIMLKQNTLL